MTSKLKYQTPDTWELETFPDYPPRDDMQNPLHLYDKGHLATLRLHFGNSDNVLVLGEVPVYWRPTRTRARVPDLIVAFDIVRDAIIDRNGYAIEEHGKPPDFALEIASPTTARNDYTSKREDYAAYGIPEYWRFDATGGRWYDAALAGDRLVDGVYQPITIHRSAEGHLWGHSDALNLAVCWEDGVLRWWNPTTGQYLLTHDEEAAGRIEEAAGRIAEAQRADRESQARIAEAQRADRESQARIDAEAERERESQARIAAEAERERGNQARLAAEARVRQLESELRRRQNP